jgi:hypothetical protein
MLIARTGFKDIGYHSQSISEEFKSRKILECRSSWSTSLRENEAGKNIMLMPPICKIYGLKHFISRTLHSLSMGNTLHFDGTTTAEISRVKSNFEMWEKG